MAKIAPSFNLGPLIEKKPLTANGSNYADWVRALRIVLRNAKSAFSMALFPRRQVTMRQKLNQKHTP